MRAWRVLEGAHDWLDAELVTVVVNKLNDYLGGRPGSAAKNAEAFFRIGGFNRSTQWVL